MGVWGAAADDSIVLQATHKILAGFATSSLSASVHKEISEAWGNPPAPVALNIYNMGTSGGRFHCGVEVYGREWTFLEDSAVGAGDRWGSVAGTGIISCRPCGCKGHSYSTSVSMGQTNASEAKVLQMLRLLGSEWQ